MTPPPGPVEPMEYDDGSQTETALAYVPIPNALVAATLNQYVDPFVSPVAVHATAAEVAAPSHPVASTNVPVALVAICTL